MPDEPRSDLAEILRRLQAVEERLRHLEEARVPRPTRPDFPPRPPPKARPAAPSLEDILRRPAEPPVAEEVPVAEEIPLAEEIPVAGQVPARKPAQPPDPFRHRERIQPCRAAKPEGDLERTIGLQWAGWVGAIVLVVGIGLGIHFAYQQGWFGHVPVHVRLALMSLGGFAFLAAGEVVYRRVSPVASAGVSGAGVAVLFVVAYAGNLYYQAYDYQAASAFAVLTMLVGSGVAIRGRLVTVAVLSQVGGLLAPLLLSTGQAPALPLLVYVLMLEAVALVLALWGGTPKWWILRVVSLVGTAWWVWVALAAGHWGRGLANEVLLFSVLYAAGYQGELLRSAYRAGPPGIGPRQALAEGWGTVFSLAVTAGLTAVALDVFYAYDSRWLRGLATLVLAGLSLAAGYFLSEDGNRLVAALRRGYRVQGMALVVLFVPVTFTGLWVSLSWGVLALAFATLGARFDRPAARAGALVTWFLALARLLGDAINTMHAREVWFSLFGEPVAGTTTTAWLLAAAGIVLAVVTYGGRWPRAFDRVAWPGIVSATASAVWCLASLADLPALGATVVLVVWAWLLVGADRLRPELKLSAHALAILVLAAVQWVLFGVAAPRALPTWDPRERTPVFNRVMGAGLLVAVSLWAMGRRRPRGLGPGAESPWGPFAYYRAFVFACAVWVVMMVGLTYEVDRWVERGLALGRRGPWPPAQLKLLYLTWLWLMGVLALAYVRQWVLFPNVVVWILFLLVAGKFLLFDMVLGRADFGASPQPARVLLNLQIMTALAVLAVPPLLAVLAPMTPLPREEGQLLRGATGLVALLVLLCAATLEVDRLVAGPLAGRLADPRLAELVAISVFWSLFAVGAVLAGFRFRVPGLRYFGLGLFAITLAKVLLLDMRHVHYGYRVVALVSLGLLLLATSVLYGKVEALASRRVHP